MSRGSNWTSQPLDDAESEGVVNWNSGVLHGNSLACAAIPIISWTSMGGGCSTKPDDDDISIFDIPLTVH